MTVLITLTTAGTDTGPFNLYSNVDGYSAAFATGVSKAALVAGYPSSAVPNGTTTIRVMSTGLCTNYVDLSVITTTTTTTTTPPTTTTTTTPPPTTTTTTTLAAILYYSSASTVDACEGNLILTSVVFTGTPGLCNATAITGDQFVSAPAGSTVWVSDGVNVREAVIDTPNVSGTATFSAACTSCTPEPTTTTTTTLEPPPPTTTTTTTPVPVICDELYNNTGSDITGVDYTDCNGTILTNQTVGSGQSICAQQGTVSGGGFLTNLGNCNA